jgi:hypothetical protein
MKEITNINLYREKLKKSSEQCWRESEEHV